MYPHLIEVHSIDAINDGQGTINLSLNIENICGINPYFDDHDRAVIAMTDGSFHVTEESYDEVKALLRDSGCHIQKADPRLDMEHPLTMDDIKRMLGEPVWNSNSGKWMLVSGYEHSFEEASFLVIDSSPVFMNAESLIKFPLYRMRREK